MLRPIHFLLSCILLFALGCSNSQPKSETSDSNTATKRHNIVFIMSDDHAQKAISAYSDELIETPNLDRIATNGVRFNNSFVTNSICAPSRAAILTGKYSHLNGKIDNLAPFNQNQWTFPEALQDEGYRTALIGKHHLMAVPNGFDEFRGLVGQGSYYNPTFVHNGDTLDPETGYTSTLITDYALEELKRNAESEEPFMLLYWHKAPHRNWMPDTDDLPGLLDKRYSEPESLRDTYAKRPAAEHADMRIADMFVSNDHKVLEAYEPKEPGTGGATFIKNGSARMQEKFNKEIANLTPAQREAYMPFLEEVGRQWQEVRGTDEELAWRYQRYMQDYLASIKSVDDNVGRVLDYLDSTGLAENTIVIYTSDQGFYLGEHGWYDKRFMYEESHRTPLLISYPNDAKKGSEVDELVLNIDLAPTLLEYAGVPIPSELQGHSLRPLLEGQHPSDWRKDIYYRYYQRMASYHRVARHEGVRGERYKLIHFTEPGFVGYELYDLETDPGEMNNRIDDPALAEVKAEMMKRFGEKRVALLVED